MMSDQSDRPDRPADQKPTDPQPTIDQPAADHGPVSMDEAAIALGISVNAVRQRVKRGTLEGYRTPTGWVVSLPTDHATTDHVGRTSTNQPPTGHRSGRDQPPTDPVNLAPLAELIERQGDEIRRLAEASTAWQFRALQAEERLKQLTAGEDAPLEHSAGTSEAERAEVGQDTPASWWQRLLGLTRR